MLRFHKPKASPVFRIYSTVRHKVLITLDLTFQIACKDIQLMLEDHFYEKLQFSGPCRKADISCEALSANEENKNVCLLKNCYKLYNNNFFLPLPFFFASVNT